MKTLSFSDNSVRFCYDDYCVSAKGEAAKAIGSGITLLAIVIGVGALLSALD